MIAGSLFSGIEGFGLGLLWSGLITSIAFQVEIDPFCRRVLEARFPGVDRSVQDVRLATAHSLPRVDLIFGGFPCQDVSAAGRGAGLTGERSGLWTEFRRIVEQLAPSVVLVENVASGARRWVCAVRNDLRSLGYRTRAIRIGVDDCGGPQRRKRIFVLAYAYGVKLRIESGRRIGAHGTDSAELAGRCEAMADANREGRLQQKRSKRKEFRRSRDGSEGLAYPNDVSGKAMPIESGAFVRPSYGGGAESAMGALFNGIPERVVRWPAKRGAEQEPWEPRRSLAGVKERGAKLKAIGNAVSPIQAAAVGEWALRVLQEVA